MCELLQSYGQTADRRVIVFIAPFAAQMIRESSWLGQAGVACSVV